MKTKSSTIFTLIFLLTACEPGQMLKLTSTPTSTITLNPSKTPTPIQTQTPELSIGSSEISPIDGMPLLYVPQGEFQMGITEDESKNIYLSYRQDKSGGQYSEDFLKESKPAHTVYLDAFWIDKTLVTNKMYKQCVLSGNCQAILSKEGHDGDQQPAVGITWYQAESYCKGVGRRLPTEAEWEKVARVIDGNGVSTYGAVELSGIATQWVADWFDDTYYENSPDKNPKGPEWGELKVLRGGNQYFNDVSTLNVYRNKANPDITAWAYGFRCAQNDPTLYIKAEKTPQIILEPTSPPRFDSISVSDFLEGDEIINTISLNKTDNSQWKTNGNVQNVSDGLQISSTGEQSSVMLNQVIHSGQAVSLRFVIKERLESAGVGLLSKIPEGMDLNKLSPGDSFPNFNIYMENGDWHPSYLNFNDLYSSNKVSFDKTFIPEVDTIYGALIAITDNNDGAILLWEVNHPDKSVKSFIQGDNSIKDILYDFVVDLFSSGQMIIQEVNIYKFDKLKIGNK